MAENTGAPFISVRDLCKAYRMGTETVVALRKVNLTVMRGEICCISALQARAKALCLICSREWSRRAREKSLLTATT